MAFGITRRELIAWKEKVKQGELAFITHYWIHPRYPDVTTVTKAGCANIDKLINWGIEHGLKPEWVHNREQFPHFDLIGPMQKRLLMQEGLIEQIKRFNL